MFPEWGAVHEPPTRGSVAALGCFIFCRRSSELGSALNEKTHGLVFRVDNSIEISNHDFTPRDFEITLQTIYLIQNDKHHFEYFNWINYSQLKIFFFTQFSIERIFFPCPNLLVVFIHSFFFNISIWIISLIRTLFYTVCKVFSV